MERRSSCKVGGFRFRGDTSRVSTRNRHAHPRTVSDDGETLRGRNRRRAAGAGGNGGAVLEGLEVVGLGLGGLHGVLGGNWVWVESRDVRLGGGVRTEGGNL